MAAGGRVNRLPAVVLLAGGNATRLLGCKHLQVFGGQLDFSGSPVPHLSALFSAVNAVGFKQGLHRARDSCLILAQSCRKGLLRERIART